MKALLPEKDDFLNCTVLESLLEHASLIPLYSEILVPHSSTGQPVWLLSALYYTRWPRKHYPSLSQVAEILLIMTQIGHFATRFFTKSKEMGTIWTSRFEDKSLNFIARYF